MFTPYKHPKTTHLFHLMFLFFFLCPNFYFISNIKSFRMMRNEKEDDWIGSFFYISTHLQANIPLTFVIFQKRKYWHRLYLWIRRYKSSCYCSLSNFFTNIWRTSQVSLLFLLYSTIQLLEAELGFMSSTCGAISHQNKVKKTYIS